MEKGLIHLYYGDGKGKTTAAAGLCIRAAGNKKRVLFTQFMKNGSSGEVLLFQKIPEIDVLYGDVPCGFYSKMDAEAKKLFAGEQDKLLDTIIKEVEEEIRIAKAHNEEMIEEASAKKEIRMLLVLDEITYAYSWNLIDREKLENLLNNRPDFLEIVMTGRNPEKFLVDAADYVTEMKCEKHPFEKGVEARKGVEF